MRIQRDDWFTRIAKGLTLLLFASFVGLLVVVFIGITAEVIKKAF